MCKITYPRIVSLFSELIPEFILTHLQLPGESALLLNPQGAKCYLLFLQSVYLKGKSSEDSCLNNIKDSNFDLLPFLTCALAQQCLDCLIHHVQCKRSRLLICILDSRLVGLTCQTNIVLGFKYS